MRAVTIVVAAAAPAPRRRVWRRLRGGRHVHPSNDNCRRDRISREIVGEWGRETTCAELVQALQKAGMDELVDELPPELAWASPSLPSAHPQSPLSRPRDRC